MTTTPVLAYWRTRTLCQPIRLLLRYAGVEFEDKYYPRGPGPEYHKKSFRDIKHTLGVDFPDLPYYMDDEVKLSQSSAILRHLARKHNLYGSSEAEKTRADLIVEEVCPIRDEFIDVCYFHPERKDEYVKQVQPKLSAIQDFLGNGPFFTGESVTFADFLVYEYLDQNKTLIPESLSGFDKLHAFLARIEALPAIKSYIESDQFVNAPIHSLTAVINVNDNIPLFLKGGSTLVKRASNVST